MGSIPVGSTKKQTHLCLLLLSRLEIEGRRFVVPIPVRSASLLIHGSTKTTVKTVVFLTPTWNRMAVDTARFPYARQACWCTGVPKSRHRRVCFCYPDLKSKDGVPSSQFPYARQALWYTGVPNDCEDSRFYMMKRKGWRFRTHKGFSEISFDKWKTISLRMEK